jgi:hypothetical protein
MELSGSALMFPCHKRVEGQSQPAYDDQKGLKNVGNGDLKNISTASDIKMKAYPDAHDILIGERQTVNVMT